MTTLCDIVVERITFQSDDWRLQGKLAYPEQGKARGGLVIAGPHPHLGGDMENNVVAALANRLAQVGFATLRFDYRGVGDSEGPRQDVAALFAEFMATSHVSGEGDWWRDLAAAVDFLEQKIPATPLALAGYSFGCSILPPACKGTRAAATGEVPLILVAPTVSKHDCGEYQKVLNPVLVIASEDDFATSTRDLDDWFDGLAMPREMQRKRCDDHFFRGHEEWVCDSAISFLNRCWA